MITNPIPGTALDLGRDGVHGRPSIPERPTLSVLMPNYNHARFLPESLDAILSQSCPATEVIVLDDASTDNSVEVIQSFGNRVKLVRNEENLGVVRAGNRLLTLAVGDYVYLPSADDKVLPGLFEKSLTLLARHPQAGLCSTAGRLIGEDGADRGVRAVPVISRRPRFLPPEEVGRALLRYGRWFDSGTVIFRRDALIGAGGQSVELGSFADTLAILVVALRHGACYVPEVLHCWRQMAGGQAAMTANDIERLREIGKSAIRLMQTEHHGLFSEEYLAGFERQWRYAVGATGVRRAAREQQRLIDDLVGRLFPAPRVIDRVFLGGLRASVRTQAFAAWLHVAFRFAPWRWWLLGRLSILLNLKTLVLAERLDT